MYFLNLRRNINYNLITYLEKLQKFKIINVLSSLHFSSNSNLHNEDREIPETEIPENTEPGIEGSDNFSMFPTKKQYQLTKESLKDEFKIWNEEVKEYFRMDPEYRIIPGNCFFFVFTNV